MAKFKDLTGQKFGRWTVVERNGSDMHHRALWKCQCECGNIGTVDSLCLTRGNSKSCGCLNDEVRHMKGVRANRTTHGMWGTKIYRTWKQMHTRCQNPNVEDYQKWYGSKGIKVCEEWSKFEPFYEWAMANGYSDELTLDRIDRNGNYCPENCRWVDIITQANNRSNNHILEINGESHTIAEWSRITGLPYSTILNRVHRGISGEDLIKPKQRGR